MTKFLLSLFFYSSFAFSQGIEIPCADASDKAVISMPLLFKPYAMIKCTRYGHIITYKEGTFWTAPGSYSPVRIPAQMIRSKPKIVNHSLYFKSITAREIKGEEAKKIYNPITQLFDMDNSKLPTTALELVAINNLDIIQKVYLISFGDSMWGYTCQTICKPKFAFMVLKTR